MTEYVKGTVSKEHATHLVKLNFVTYYESNQRKETLRLLKTISLPQKLCVQCNSYSLNYLVLISNCLLI